MEKWSRRENKANQADGLSGLTVSPSGKGKNDIPIKPGGIVEAAIELGAVVTVCKIILPDRSN